MYISWCGNCSGSSKSGTECESGRYFDSRVLVRDDGVCVFNTKAAYIELMVLVERYCWSTFFVFIYLFAYFIFYFYLFVCLFIYLFCLERAV
jgi:hypothetical protein